ncbi:hypothetical protein, partial [Treponema sp.]|uniref:hypothetical protein n=1 Tax=Treponema sp. TaxID=166 RepID=UPI00298DFAAF
MNKIILILSVFLFLSCKQKKTVDDLRQAVRIADVSQVEELLKNKELYNQSLLKDLAGISIRKNHNFKIVKLLCENGLPVNSNARFIDGSFIYESSLLSNALIYENDDFVTYLLDHNVDLNIRINSYNNAFEYSLSKLKGKYFC